MNVMIFQIPFKRWPVFLFALISVQMLVSCGASKKTMQETLYLQGNLDTLPNLTVPTVDMLIQKGDKLAIVVYSDNAVASADFNIQSIGAAGSAATPGGYLVDSDGAIHFNKFGKLKVEGLTRQQLSALLAEKLKQDLSNPYVDIRFLNFRVSVIGEVLRPAVYSIPEEKLSVLELVALAGDLTIYGRRDNILVIREKEGTREFGRIDLRDPKLFQSPYFYLQQNDVVLVEPTKKKPSASEQTTLRNISLGATLVSTLAIIVTLIRTF